MKRTLVGLLLAVLACGSDTPPPPKDVGFRPTSGHALNDAPAWSTQNGVPADTAECDNADVKRIVQSWIVSCYWKCVHYQGALNTDLQVTMVQDPVGTPWRTAQEQSSLYADPACNQ